MDYDDRLRTAPLPELIGMLHSTPDGLRGAEATLRLRRHGANEIPVARPHPLLELAGCFWAPVPWMIETVLALALLTHRWADAAAVGVLLVVTGLIGLAERRGTAATLTMLERGLARQARVRRDGQWTAVPARDVVLGDVLLLRPGDIVPADVRLLQDTTVQLDQWAVTGQWTPVVRHQGDAVPAGAVVVRGQTQALVHATGRASSAGRAATRARAAGVVRRLPRAAPPALDHLIGIVAAVAATMVLLAVAASLARGNPPLRTLEYALALMVAPVPVALPAVTSATVAVGARRLARRQALVRQLPAVQTLAGVDVVCVNKTGTLTPEHAAVAAPWTAPGVDAAELLAAAALASRARDRDPVDLAVLAAAPATTRAPGVRVEAFLPFDPVRQRSEATVRAPDGERLRVTKGAPRAITDLCRDDPAAAGASEVVSRWGAGGYRALGVARADGDRWRLLGMLPFADPPRPGSAGAVADARELGLAVKVVTGDHLAIARHVADRVALGAEIRGPDSLEPEILDPERAGGFAQVRGEDRYRIVRALQRRGHVVAMTGSAVTDAPALKRADAGLAVAGAADAARARAEVVFGESGLPVIVDAIRLARQAVTGMAGYASCRIAEALRLLLLITASVVVLDFLPITTPVIVLLAVLNDGVILAVAHDRVRAPDHPTVWQPRTVLTLATTLGVVGGAQTCVLLALTRCVMGLDQDLVRTLIYLTLSVSGHLTIFVTRTRGPLWSRPAPPRRLVVAVLGAQLVATGIAGYGLLMAPLGWGNVALVWGYALAWFLVADRVKLATHRWLDRHPPRRRRPRR